MDRILVLGSGGSGKSTLSRLMGDRLDLPVIHLDTHYWNAGWTPTPEPLWRDRVSALVAQPRWIMDGNFSGTFDLRFPRAQGVVFLDIPRILCLARVLRRWRQFAGRTRPDLPPHCPESLDFEFLQWVWAFPSRSRPAVLKAIEAHRAHGPAWVLRSPVEVERFVESLR